MLLLCFWIPALWQATVSIQRFLNLPFPSSLGRTLAVPWEHVGCRLNVSEGFCFLVLLPCIFPSELAGAVRGPLLLTATSMPPPPSEVLSKTTHWRRTDLATWPLSIAAVTLQPSGHASLSLQDLSSVSKPSCPSWFLSHSSDFLLPEEDCWTR